MARSKLEGVQDGKDGNHQAHHGQPAQAVDVQLNIRRLTLIVVSRPPLEPDSGVGLWRLIHTKYMM